MEDDHGTVFRRQPAEGVLEGFAIDDGARRIGSRVSDGKDSECCVPTLRAARLRVAGIDDETVQPGVESFGIAERRKVTPRAKQCLLAGILGAVLVAQDAIGEGVAAIDVARGQRRERIAITCRCPNHEILLLHPSRPLG